MVVSNDSYDTEML